MTFCPKKGRPWLSAWILSYRSFLSFIHLTDTNLAPPMGQALCQLTGCAMARKYVFSGLKMVPVPTEMRLGARGLDTPKVRAQIRNACPKEGTKGSWVLGLPEMQTR